MRKPLLLAIFLVLTHTASYGAQESKAEQEIRKVDQERVAALLRADVPMLEKFMTDDFTYTHSNGATQTKTEFLSDMKNVTWKFLGLELQDIKVRVYGDSALLTGRCHLIGMVRGKDVSFPMHFSEVYKRNGKQWQWVMYQSTRLPQ